MSNDKQGINIIKSLLVLLILRYGKHKKNTSQISNFSLVLQQKTLVMTVGQVEFFVLWRIFELNVHVCYNN